MPDWPAVLARIKKIEVAQDCWTLVHEQEKKCGRYPRCLRPKTFSV
jgi:hypothetical protein